MMHLRGLFIDEDPDSVEEQDFVRAQSEIDAPIFSMMSLNGSLKSGERDGKWTPPGPSPTNTVLLWPNALQYFSAQARKVIENGG